MPIPHPALAALVLVAACGLPAPLRAQAPVEHDIVVAPARVTAAQLDYDRNNASESNRKAAEELDQRARTGLPVFPNLVSQLEHAERRIAGHPTRFKPLADQLNARTPDGFRLVALATPEFPFVPRHTVAVMARAAGENRPVPVRYAVVGSFLPWQLEERINALAADGYRVAGFTLAEDAMFGRPWSYEAVLARDLDDTGPPSTYKVVRTGVREGDWRALERAGRDGFLVVDMISRPDLATAARGESIFLLEKREVAPRPLTYTLAWKNSAASLEKEVNGLAAKGHRMVLAWPARDFLNALMVRLEGATAAAPYEIDADPLGLPSVSSSSGRLVSWVRFKGEQVGLYEKVASRAYDVHWDPLLDRPSDEVVVSVRRDRPELWALLERLSGKAQKGLRAYRATYRREDGLREVLDVFLEQPTAP